MHIVVISLHISISIPQVKDRCFSEWEAFHARMEHAVQAYYKEKGIAVPTKYKSLLIKRNKSTAYHGEDRNS